LSYLRCWDDARIEGCEVCTQLKKNLISIGTLEALSLEVSIKDGILKMIKGSMVVLKSIRCNNLLYLKGSTVIG